MKQTRSGYVQTRRDAWVEINLGHIEHNIKELKKFPNIGTKLLAVVKADAYGHGSVMSAPTLLASGVDMLGVASIDEGLQLRDAKITAPILVLGSAPEWAFVAAVENNISLSIFSNDHINACKFAYEKTGIKPRVHVKVDTGMNRIGVCVDDAIDYIQKIQNSPYIRLEGVFTHFANAENIELTSIQLDKWKKVVSSIQNKENILFHCSNTAALISFPDLNFDMVRAGIGLYGLMPDLDASIKNIPDLKQVISLKGRIANIHQIKPGEGISYGYSFVANKCMKIATIPLGYADGVPRVLSNKIYGLLNGQKVKQVGNITMDQMMLDITDVPDAQIGEIITLLGEDNNSFIPIDDWAKILGTIHYELTCRLKVRLPRVYTR